MGKNPIILIVDDDVVSIEVASQAVLLRFTNATIHTARSGQECMSVLQSVMPDVVLMDLKLPFMDGWEALQNMRSDQRLSTIPVVAVTGYHSASVANDVLLAGFNAFVPKPIDLDLLNQTLASII